jgi:hypothetical protein
MTMSAKAKSGKKRLRPDLSEGPAELRRQHTAFTSDVLTPSGAPVIARHRTRTILTPLTVRRAILEEAASKPEAVRVRSLRRRLTVLDRALSDREAEALDRLTSCLNSLSNIGCVSYLGSEIRSTPYGRLPFGDGKRQEIAAMNYVLKGLPPACKSAVLELAAVMDPSQSQGRWRPGEEFVAAMVTAGAATATLYEEWARARRSKIGDTAPRSEARQGRQALLS